MRDNHLRSAKFFDVEKYPKMAFKTTTEKKIEKDKGKYDLICNRTLHGTTKPVTITIWFRGTITNPLSKVSTAAFKFNGILKRFDFNIGFKFLTPMISNEAIIEADCEFINQQLSKDRMKCR